MKAIVVDCSGPEISRVEQELFRATRPAGFILFQRNCVSTRQVMELVSAMREACGNPEAPVLIDQEGGSVARLRAPVWAEYASARDFGLLGEDGAEAAQLNSCLMALDLAEMGVTVNCAPVVDVPAPDCHEFLSASRTFDAAPDRVGELGRAVCDGLLQGAVTPVIKHIPGHGRARVDSHFGLPVVEADFAALAATDFKPFKYLAQSDLHPALWAMAAHVVYSAIDPDSAASVSSRVVRDVIRGEIGFDGVLIADDVSMKALGGTVESRVAATMRAGMDLTMLCNASLEDREKALSVCPLVEEDAARRLSVAEAARKAAGTAVNADEARDRLARLMRKRNIA